MKKIIFLVLCFLSFSSFATTWDKPQASTNELKTFITKEVGERNSVKFYEIQQDKDAKQKTFLVYAVVENSYQPEVGDAQKSISCDTMVVVKNKSSYQIVSWNKNDCDIEDIIFLKQK